MVGFREIREPHPYIESVTLRVTSGVPDEKATIDQLVKIGFTTYQAKVYCALVSLGVGSVSEIYRNSRVPRTKVYETLEDLVRQGAAELQAGRPALYRGVHPKSLARRLIEDYTDSANEVSKTLERDYQESRGIEYDLVWTVKGDQAIRRKMAEVISSARDEVLMLETYPPSFTLAVGRLLKAVAQRGVRVSAVSVLAKDQVAQGFQEDGLIEYRSFPARVPHSGAAQDLDEDFLGPLAVTLSSPYGVAVIDRKEAVVIVPNTNDKSKSVGLSVKIPGVPMLLSAMFQKFLIARTRKIRN